MKLRDIKRRTKTNYISINGMRFIRDYTGKRCREYVAGCTTCDGWRFFDRYGRFVYNFEELRSFMNYTENEWVERFIHDPNKVATKFVPPISLMRAVTERRLGDTLLDEEDVMRNYGVTPNFLEVK